MDQNYENESGNGKKIIWVVGGVILVIMIVALVYGATQRSLNQASPSTDANIKVATPATSASSTGTSVLGASETIPTPVTLKGMEVVNLETIPQQVQAKISYGLQGGCSTIGAPTVERSGTTFTVILTATAPKGASCSSDIVPGDVVVAIPVDGVPAGKYSVKAGTLAKPFTLKADSQVQPTGDK